MKIGLINTAFLGAAAGLGGGILSTATIAAMAEDSFAFNPLSPYVVIPCVSAGFVGMTHALTRWTTNTYREKVRNREKLPPLPEGSSPLREKLKSNERVWREAGIEYASAKYFGIAIYLGSSALYAHAVGVI